MTAVSGDLLFHPAAPTRLLGMLSQLTLSESVPRQHEVIEPPTPARLPVTSSLEEVALLQSRLGLFDR